MNIPYTAITILVQGSVMPDTRTVMKGLRTIFPGSELILSTWEGSEVSGLDYDKLVLSPDPGGMVCDEVTGTMNNINRQLCSTKAGLRVAETPYVLKTRTDILFLDTEFLSYFGQYDAIPSRYFQNRLLICNYYTRNPRIMALCFHPSDWILFGKAEDVRNYYEDTPFMSEEEGNWFHTHEKISTFFTNYVCRYTPEQYLFLNFLNRQEEANAQTYYDSSPALLKQTEYAFAMSFVVLDYQKQLNIKFMKYNPNRYLEKHTLIFHWQWRALYEHYCVRRFSPRWWFYLAWCSSRHLLASIRTLCVKILNYIGLKEFVKKLLWKC